MVGASIAKNVNVSATLKKAYGTIRAVYVQKVGGASDKVDFRDNNSDSDSGTIIFTVMGNAIVSMPLINARFGSGIRCTVTGTAEYLIVYD